MDYNYIPAKKDSKKCLVIAGGSGDDKDSFSKITDTLNKKAPEINICTFSYTDNSETAGSFRGQVSDLRDIFKEMLSLGNKEIILFATSMGAYCATHILAEGLFREHIKTVIFFDPADYDDDLTSPQALSSWSGFENYNPKSTTLVDKLSTVSGDMIIHTIHLTLKNHGRDGYISEEFAERKHFSDKLFPRLNSNMVKAFYESTHKQNQGEYIEIHDIPHGIVRDGDLEYNAEVTTELIIRLL